VREIRAFHEAGHAAVAVLRGLEVRRLTISRRGRIGGACEYRFAVPSRGARAAVRRMVRDAAAVALGGSVAQDRAALERGYLALDPRTGRPFPLFTGGAEDDEKTALRFASRLYRDAGARRAFLGRMRTSAERLLAEPRNWAAVERLARALLRERTIEGAAAVRIVRRAAAGSTASGRTASWRGPSRRR
jgi:hypothetical protein